MIILKQGYVECKKNTHIDSNHTTKWNKTKVELAFVYISLVTWPMDPFIENSVWPIT